MRSITEPAPAKVNIYLKVLGRRQDGYHDIETLFERIDIADKIRMRECRLNRIGIKCSDRSIPTDSRNICYKAAMLVKEEFGIEKGLDIEIAKKTPVAAGLGGGSSDAASVIKGLNRMWKLDLDKKDLVRIAAKIGSDVAFFVLDTSFALGRGRGELLKEVRSLARLYHLVITPDIKLLSGDIYRLYSQKTYLNLTMRGSVDRIRTPKLRLDNMGQLKTILHNDLEGVVIACEPIIKYIKDTIVSSGAVGAIVSGSGPSVFGVYSSRKEAIAAKKYCLRRISGKIRCRAFVAETC